jgi:hypothetical protein
VLCLAGLHVARTRTGDAAWEYKAMTQPYGFSRNGRYYEPRIDEGDSYDDYDEFGMGGAAAAAFTEDVTWLFQGLPSLVDLELGAYTFMRGDEATSRKLQYKALSQAAPGGNAPPRQQRLQSLKILVLNIIGLLDMLTPGVCVW